MATQRAIDTRAKLVSLITQVQHETRRLADTIQSTSSHASLIIDDTDVPIPSETVIEDAAGGEISARLAWPPAIDLTVQKNGAGIAVEIDRSKAIITFDPLSPGDVLTAAYTHQGLRSEIIELYAATGESIPEVQAQLATIQALRNAIADYLT